jgi:hypothetical protein
VAHAVAHAVRAVVYARDHALAVLSGAT